MPTCYSADQLTLMGQRKQSIHRIYSQKRLKPDMEYYTLLEAFDFSPTEKDHLYLD